MDAIGPDLTMVQALSGHTNPARKAPYAHHAPMFNSLATNW